MRALLPTTTFPTKPPMRRPARRSGLVFWASRMLGIGADARYADIMERALYNGVAVWRVARWHAVLLRKSAREPRRPQPLVLAPLPVLPAEYCAPRRLGRQLRLWRERRRDRRSSLWGERGSLRYRRERRCVSPSGPQYPWDGAISITLEPEEPSDFTLLLRMPAWCRRRP